MNVLDEGNDVSQGTLNPPEDESLNAGLEKPELTEGEDTPPEVPQAEADIPFDTATYVDQLPNDPPELNEAETTQTTAAVEDLLNLIRDIKANRGMCRAYAQEAERISPGFVTESIPLGYYSRDLSSTRLKISLEGLFAKVWEYLKAAFQKLVDYITTLINWVLSKVRGKKAGQAETKEQMKQEAKTAEREAEAEASDWMKTVEAMFDEAERLNNAARQGVNLGEGEQTKQVSDLDRLIGEVMGNGPEYEQVKDFMLGKDPFFYDFTSNGPYQEHMAACGRTLALSLGIVQEKVNLLATLLAETILSTAEQPSTVSPASLKLVLEPTRLSGSGHDTVSSFAMQLTNLHHNLSESSGSSSPLDFVAVFQSLARALKRDTLTEVNRATSAATMMLIDIREVLSTVVEHLDRPQQDHQAESTVDWHKVVAALQTDLAGYSAVVTATTQYYQQTRLMLSRVVRFAEVTGKEIERRLAKDQSNSEIHLVVRNLVDEARKAEAKFKQHYHL